jgi:hypothetical protein
VALAYEGGTIRELNVESFCGGGLIPLGLIDLSRQELHVPLAHQSGLAGVLLAGALVRRAVGKRAEATITTRIDMARPLGDFLTLGRRTAQATDLSNTLNLDAPMTRSPNNSTAIEYGN